MKTKFKIALAIPLAIAGLLVLAVGASAAEAPSKHSLAVALQEALAKEDLTAVRAAAAAGRRALGDKAACRRSRTSILPFQTVVAG